MTRSSITLGIIPARAGSKGVPKKNLKLLGGKSLVAHAAQVGLASKCDHVCLTTDSHECAQIGQRLGLEVIDRPSKLASDRAAMIDVLQHAIKHIEKEKALTVDTVVLLQPTSPFRTSLDVNRALGKLKKEKADSVVSVVKVADHLNPCTMMMEEKGKLFFPLNPGYRYARRQDMPQAYIRNGALYVFRRNLLSQAQPTFFGKKCLKYLMGSEFCINIDSLEDLKQARRLWKRWESENQ